MGNILRENKPSSTTRLYFQNLNGIGWNAEGGEWPAICEAIASIHTDILCCVEINQDTNKKEVREKIKTINNRHFKHHRYIASTSQWRTERTYKPGGTAIMVVEGITSLVHRTFRDRMGRWASVRLLGENNTGITIISAYQVCQNKVTGKNTVVNQQISQLIEEASRANETERINPREAFIRELQTFIDQQQENGDQIILVGDFNEEITDIDSGMSNIATTCNLVDMFGARLGSPNIPSTWQRGKKRIDYALVSPQIAPMIKSAGYEPYSYRITSDHRGFFIDLDTKATFGNKPSPIAPLAKRDFESHHPGIIPKYITSMTQELQAHNFKNRITQLANLTQPNHQLAEALDKDIERAAKHAARKCKKTYSTPWSPAFSRAWATIRYWKLQKTNQQTTSSNTQKAINKWREIHPYLPTDKAHTAEQINQGYQQARRQLQEMRQQAAQLRADHLKKQVQMYTDLEESGKEKILHRIKQAEAMKRTYQQIRAATKNNSKEGITHLIVPNDPNIDPRACPTEASHWRTERTPQEIERLLITRNQKHFGQANETPFITTGIQSQVQYNGSGRVADLILNGEYDTSTFSEITQLFIQHLKRRTESHLTGEITRTEFLDKLKYWPEKTSTSPSGLHLGHYQVLRRHHGLATHDPQRKAVEAGQKLLTDARVALLNYALKFGYTYTRWRQVVNVMLMKEPGNPQIHRLRVIHLYEADYNLMLAVKWRAAMHHAEDKKLLNEGMYGSRAGRSAHDPVFIELLQNEIYRCSMKSGINFDLDASACYDRILASVATIASRRIGMAKQVVIVNATTLQAAKYKLKTSLGISDQWYSHCTEFPIHGTGQGSGNSPQIWCFVCSVLFDAIESTTQGATFTSHDGSNTTTIHMVGFVDDCTQRANAFQAETQPTAEQLCQQMQHEAQQWNDLLWDSGGALETKKCSFHLIESDWNQDGTPFLKGGTQASSINIKKCKWPIPGTTKIQLLFTPNFGMLHQPRQQYDTTKNHTSTKKRYCSSHHRNKHFNPVRHKGILQQHVSPFHNVPLPSH